MLFAIGPALGALSAVGSLLESAASSIGQEVDKGLSTLGQKFTADNQSSSNPATGGTAASPFNSDTLATLISLQGQNGVNSASGLFAKLDTDGDGSISKSEFESALGNAGVDANSADSVFAKLDANGDGSISKSELASARGGYHSHHHAHHAGGGSGGGAASLLNATSADGSTTQTTTNPDGSTTTTITYVDGSTVSSTTAAPQTGSAGTPGRGNLLEQLVKLQAMLKSPVTGTTAVLA